MSRYHIFRFYHFYYLLVVEALLRETLSINYSLNQTLDTDGTR